MTSNLKTENHKPYNRSDNSIKTPDTINFKADYTVDILKKVGFNYLLLPFPLFLQRKCDTKTMGEGFCCYLFL